MPGCNLLGPINVYERPAAAVTVLVKCLRMHDSTGLQEQSKHVILCQLGSPKAPVPPQQATERRAGRPSGSHALIVWPEMSMFDQIGPGFEFR
jgi:hypothetical protein